MLARRIIVLCADKPTSKQLTTALRAAGGAVDAHSKLDDLGKGELQASLVVIHLAGDLANAAAEIIPRITGEGRVILILPKPDLVALVAQLQLSERVAGMMIAEQLDTAQLTGMATRILSGDIFGLEKMVPWGTLVHSQLVGDYQEKSLCIAQLSEFAEAMGVRRKYREAIEQCADEMLMNALYDAPVDDAGQPIFAEVPTKTRISLRVEQKVVVQYACDGRRFALSVRDAFGTLERETVLRYLHKCLHAEQQIDRKAGGAGLGLYLMANSATTVYFNVLPHVATEATCVFDLESAKLQLGQFGFFTEKIDAAGRLATGPSRKLPAGASHPVERRSQSSLPIPAQTPRALVAVLGAAIVAMLALIAVVAYPRLSRAARTTVTFASVPPGAQIEIEGKSAGTAGDAGLKVGDLEVGRAYPVIARLDGYEPKQAVVQPRAGGEQVTLDLHALAPKVELDSQPPGASVEIDGAPAGTTPVTIATLAPGKSVTIAFHKAGYHDTSAHLDVPGPGKELHLVQPLAVADELARVRIESDPPGAQVVQNGQVLAGVQTPAEVLVEAGKTQRFVLTMPHHVPAVLEAFTPARGDANIKKTAKLAAGSEVRFEANLDAKITIANAPYCRDVVLPGACVLAPGSYTVDLTGATNAHATRTITVAAADRVEKFELGYVAAGKGKQLRLASVGPVPRAAFEVGPRTVPADAGAGTHQATVRVAKDATVVAE